MKWSVSLLAATCLAGCVVPPQPGRRVLDMELHTTFDSAEAAEMLRDGANTIQGYAMLRQAGGGVVTCAGETVELIPATAYADERMAKIYGFGVEEARRITPEMRFNPDDPDYAKAIRRTRCDPQGAFLFPRVADGRYYLVTRVIWQVGYSEQGGFLMRHIRVDGGKEFRYVISPTN